MRSCGTQSSQLPLESAICSLCVCRQVSALSLSGPHDLRISQKREEEQTKMRERSRGQIRAAVAGARGEYFVTDAESLLPKQKRQRWRTENHKSRAERKYSRVLPALVVDAVDVAVLLVVGIFDFAVENFGFIEQLTVAASGNSPVSKTWNTDRIIMTSTYKHKTRSSFAYIGCPLAAGAMADAAGGV